MATVEDGAAPPAKTARTSIVLRAPEGEVGWTLVELQGTIEPRSGTLDGIKFARLVRDEVRSSPSLHRIALLHMDPQVPRVDRLTHASLYREEYRGSSWAKTSWKARRSHSRSPLQ